MTQETYKGVMIQNPTLTRSNQRNLLKLAKYLWNLPSDYSRFDMRDYYGGRTLEQRMADGADAATACGTSACAIGHGIDAGIPCRRQDKGWNAYSTNFVPAFSYLEYNWCFHARWTIVDNTTGGAVRRILVLLKHGVPFCDAFYAISQTPINLIRKEWIDQYKELINIDPDAYIQELTKRHKDGIFI